MNTYTGLILNRKTIGLIFLSTWREDLEDRVRGEEGWSKCHLPVGGAVATQRWRSKCPTRVLRAKPRVSP